MAFRATGSSRSRGGGGAWVPEQERDRWASPPVALFQFSSDAGNRAIAFGVKTLVVVGDSGVITTSSAGGIQGLIYTALFGTYQCVLDGVIDKDDTKTLTMTFEQTWARRP